MMSCAGNRWLKTPAMDGLASRGVRFERAYCGNPVCVPSRFSMMTGTLPSRIGMDRNGPASFPVTDAILQNSLGHVFRRAGYHTVYGGKVHLPGTRSKGIGAYGFDMLTGDEREGLAQACEQFFEQDHDKPFLMVASFINPHDICYMAIDAYTKAQDKPLMYPGSDRERECLAEALQLPPGISRDEFFKRLCPPVPDNFEIPANEPAAARDTDWREFRQYVQENWSRDDWRRHRWAYARLTERVDALIGKVLDALRRCGLQEKTTVVFVSDHGDMDAAHRLEHKSMPYEEASRVPFIVSGAGVTARGRIDREHLISTGLDLIPTLCDFAGIEVPTELAGHSVKPLTQSSGRPKEWRKDVVVENEGSRVLVSERHKYAVYDHGEPREMLVDLKSDPGEMDNLAVDSKHASLLVDHRNRLRAWYDSNKERLDEKYIVT
jgi:choline-sulfatase